MRVLLQPAVILHQRSYRETSVLLDVLTRDHGKISLMARGVRRPKSVLRPLLQPFVPLLVSWQGRSELMTLTAAEAEGRAFLLSGKKLLSGFYLNELLIRLLQKHDPHAELYALYYQTLIELEKIEFETAGEKILRYFEKKLLEELGYGLQLKNEAATHQPIREEGQYVFYPEEGFRLVQTDCHARREHSERSGIQGFSQKETLDARLLAGARLWHDSAAFENWVFSGKTLIDLQQENLEDEQSLRQAKRLMRLALLPLIGNKPLQSRRLFLHE